MQRILRCRQCERLSSGRRSFLVPGASPHYAPDLPFRLEHILIDVSVDPRAKTLEGEVTQKVRVVSPGQERISLDQVGLEMEKAWVNGQETSFAVESGKLHVRIPKSPKPGETLEIKTRYKAREPRRGLYFTGPDSDYPKKPYQVWSQGQDEDNRYWIPTFDYPNQKAISEVIATVPKGFTAVSNGALLSRDEKGDRVRYHYKLGTPHVTYLISLVVAEFEAWEDAGPSGLPVQYFVPVGRKDDGVRAFGNTPKMIAAYASKIGVPYPYEKYSQVAVQDFIFGGMENTSATTQTDRTLHDARAHLDFSSDPLVSHELAHQWFGDLLTCREWAHAWLNEGFATFMERVWIEANTEEYGSAEAAREEAKYYSYVDLKEHLEEDAGRYRRPIVCNTYIEPIDLFDTHLYQKGGLVLNLLRATLGEEAFWKSIQLYVTRHRGQSVETLNLIQAIEDATGRNLRQFFDQWVFRGGYPELELNYQWQEDRTWVELVIEQKQTQGKPELVEDGVATPLFRLPVRVELTLEGGKKVVHTVDIGTLRDRAFLPAESKPLMVRFDPESTIPKTMKFPRPKEMLLYQLANDPDCMGRIEAARELTKIPDTDVVEALGKAALSDRFWGVQAEAASALAELRSDPARDALIRALAAKNPKARRAIAKALGTYRGEKAAAALRKVAEKDESYLVEAEATHAYSRAGEDQPDEVEKFLVDTQLKKPSFLDVTRAAALRGLAELRGIGRGERPRAMATLVEWTRRGQSVESRGAAVAALGRMAKTAVPSERARALEVLSKLADEDNFRLRLGLVSALAATEAPEAIPVLERIHRLEIDGRIRRDALAMRDHLLAAGSAPESVATLRTALEKLEEDHRKLKATVEELKAAQTQRA